MIEEDKIVKEPIIGEFKPKRKFLSFVSAVSRSRIRFIRETAFIKGSLLSGTLDGLKFKFTICDEGTINFEEVDTTITDKAQRQRLLDDIDSTDVTGYAQKFIVSGLEFTDIDGNICYLEVDHQKPIDKLKSLFDEPVTEEKTEISERGLSILDQLFGGSDDVVVESTDEPIVEEEVKEEVKEKKESISYLEESFKKMNMEKIEELKRRIDDKGDDIKKCKTELNNSEKKLTEDTKQLRILENRLESMVGFRDEPNGYVFYISEEQKSDIELDDVSKEIAGKIATLIGLKKDILFKSLIEGFYQIKISKKENTDNDPKIDNTILEKITSIDIVGKMSMVNHGEFEYRGEFNWHQLVQKMINKGFEQSPEFDKLCQSNSYESKEEKVEKKCDCVDKECGNECKCKKQEENMERKNKIYKSNELIFAVFIDEESGEFAVGQSVAITPKDHFEKEGCMADFIGGHNVDNAALKMAGICTCELMEGIFEVNDQNLSEDQIKANMISAGFEFSEEFDSFLSENHESC